MNVVPSGFSLSRKRISLQAYCVLTGFIGGISLLLTGCGSGSHNAPSASPSPSPVASASPTPTPTPTPTPAGLRATLNPSAPPSAAQKRLAFYFQRSVGLSSSLDIAVLHADGSGLTTLTGDKSVHPAALYSHVVVAAGDNVFFVSERAPNSDLTDIYRVRTDGSSLTRLTRDDTPGRSPVVSPDGQRVAFVSATNPRHFTLPVGNLPPYPITVFDTRLYAVNADGGGLTLLTPPDEVAADFPAYAPDGQRIAFSHASPLDLTILQITGLPQIFVMNADGTNRQQLTDGAGGTEPFFSRDGKRLFFTEVYENSFSNRPLRYDVINADGSSDPHTRVPLNNSTALNGNVPISGESPDGGSFAAAVRHADETDLFFVSQTPAVAPALFLTFPDEEPYLGMENPAFSPDGKLLAYWRPRKENAGATTFLSPTPTAAGRRVSPSTLSSPALSPGFPDRRSVTGSGFW